MTDVTIPADVAHLMADLFRGMSMRSNGTIDFDHWVALLDPQPTLVDAMIAAFYDGAVSAKPGTSTHEAMRRALAVIADEADALVLKHPGRADLTAAQFVAWLRGES